MYGRQTTRSACQPSQEKRLPAARPVAWAEAPVGGGSASEIEKYDRIFLISLLSSGNAATLVWTTTRLRVTKLENWDDGSRRFAWHFAQTAGQAPVAG